MILDQDIVDILMKQTQVYYISYRVNITCNTIRNMSLSSLCKVFQEKMAILYRIIVHIMRKKI